MKLSIIIPMYGVEQYVERCLMSCIDQDLKETDYEIIVVNDGSPDKSLEIAQRVSNSCPNMKIINKENGGLSSARNVGLLHAKGDYVWFVDSDDWIEKRCLASIMQTCYDYNLDAFIIQGIRYVDGVMFRMPLNNTVNKMMTGQKFMKQRPLNCAAVKTITKRKMIIDNNLSFYEGIYHEDAEYSPRLYYYLNRVWESDNYVYYNRLTPNSITQSINPKKGFDMLLVSEHLWEFVKIHNMDDSLKTAYYMLIASDLNAAFSNMVKASENTQNNFMSVFSKRKILLDSYLLTKNFKFYIAGCLFKLFPSKVISIYKFFKS